MFSSTCAIMLENFTEIIMYLFVEPDRLPENRAKEEGLIDFEFYYWRYVNDFVGYMYAFRFRHPIIYYLCYRYLIARCLDAKYLLDVQKHLAERSKSIPEDRGRSSGVLPGDLCGWDEFALYHPYLFLFVYLFKSSKHLLTSVTKKVGRFVKS